jgi:hypothetical protein
MNRNIVVQKAKNAPPPDCEKVLFMLIYGKNIPSKQMLLNMVHKRTQGRIYVEQQKTLINIHHAEPDGLVLRQYDIIVLLYDPCDQDSLSVLEQNVEHMKKAQRLQKFVILTPKEFTLSKRASL